MLLLVKQIHLPSETLVHIEGEWRGGEKREGKLLFIWGEKGVCAKLCLILVTKQDKGKTRLPLIQTDSLHTAR